MLWYLDGRANRRVKPADKPNENYARELLEQFRRRIVAEPRELELGVHEVVVRAARYQVHSSEVSIDEPGESHELSVELVPAWAAVTIRSDPSGAEVGVDGAVLGTTPLIRRSAANASA